MISAGCAMSMFSGGGKVIMMRDEKTTVVAPAKLPRPGAEIDNFKRAFGACLDARGYSVK